MEVPRLTAPMSLPPGIPSPCNQDVGALEAHLDRRGHRERGPWEQPGRQRDHRAGRFDVPHCVPSTSVVFCTAVYGTNQSCLFLSICQ